MAKPCTTRSPIRISRDNGDMRLSYDTENDSLYVHFSERPGTAAREVADGVVIDIDEHGAIVGLDIEYASQKLDLNTLDTGGLPFSKSA